MFGGQAILTRQSAITGLMKAQQKPKTPVKDYMITLMGYFVEVMDNKDFVGFWAAYNLGSKNLMLTQLMKKLQSYDLMLNNSQPIQRVEENIVVASSLKEKGKCNKKGKAKARNKHVMEGISTTRQSSIAKILSMIEELRVLNENLPVPKAVGSDCWRPPQDPWVKLNFDAAYKIQTNKSCSGFIIRNGRGKVMGSGVTHHGNISDTFMAE
ncbi:hypothetical protein Gohar_019817, partial [Gossypium harknessii]|nr:hypothetical protein [Gossypium harknessii]